LAELARFLRVEAIPAVRANNLFPTHSPDFLRLNDASTLRAGDIEGGEDFLPVDLLSGRHERGLSDAFWLLPGEMPSRCFTFSLSSLSIALFSF
jgi:hypothetical protein